MTDEPKKPRSKSKTLGSTSGVPWVWPKEEKRYAGRPNKQLSGKEVRVITKILAGFVLAAESPRTAMQVRESYNEVARTWNFPIPWISEQSAIQYLQRSVAEQVLDYNTVPLVGGGTLGLYSARRRPIEPSDVD